jgi:hypothetical protein
MAIGREEFLYHMSLVRSDIAGVKSGQDQLLERQHAIETEIAVLKATQTKPRRRLQPKVWRTVIGALAAIAGALAAFGHAFVRSAAAGAKP